MKKYYVTAVLIILIAGVTGNVFRYFEKNPDRMADFEVIPMELEQYRGQEFLLDEVTIDVLNATSTTMRRYHTIDKYVYDLFIGYFKSQKFGGSIHSPKHCLPGGGWKIRDNEAFMLKLDDSTTKEINRLIIALRDERSVMLYWFETRAGHTREEFGLKFDLFKNALFMRPTDAAFIRVTVDAPDGDIASATVKAVEFLKDFYPSIRQSLPFDD